MAYKTISAADAAAYPAMAGKVGQTVTVAQFRTMKRDSKKPAAKAPAKAAAKKAPAKKAAAKKATAKKAPAKKK